MPKLLKPESFLPKYNLPVDSIEKTGLEWTALEAIYVDHSERLSALEDTAVFVAARLRRIDAVHSIKIRVKDPEHLVAKVIRKKLEDSARDITPENYKENITDLIGVRALHLFKEDWAPIHNFVEGNWDLHERPVANIRKGDPDEYVQQFKDKGCEINPHKYGYRSVHYLIESKPERELFITELQVRTLFEEGWSEIDHRVRYPYDMENALLTQLSAIHNRLAGGADEIGSFIKILKFALKERDEQISEALEKHERAVTELDDYVQKLAISQKEKAEVEKRLKSVSKTSSSAGDISGLTSMIKAIKSFSASAALVNAQRDAAEQARRAMVFTLPSSLVQPPPQHNPSQPKQEPPEPVQQHKQPLLEGKAEKDQPAAAEGKQEQKQAGKEQAASKRRRRTVRSRGGGSKR